ncbi:MAG TPA: tRNA pseudouridine(38-40) synthase TruA [Candidatus Blautia stercoripullorum]|uniref:tRNA pseudouridine synthase A n=1 Tax=Candidatus Blautia stercoripullorum TaxID=2838502 RepID=A0A9D2R6V0_9FIRM|nr:tRNA pseudouridine(38-40) synthase TruA [Candidatus Blautia stercoripullorum]
MNYRFDIQYDGTRYGGWQRQKTTDNTIQGKIEEVLFRMTGSPVPIQGAGRTDAGVHALGQVANGRFDSRLNCEEICDYMNHYLPEDIEILRVSQVSERFHSRLNAKEKLYRYRIGIGSHKNVFERKYICPLHETYDVEAMEKAAGYLTGTHDFRSFCANKKMKKSTVRTIYEIKITEFPKELQIDYRGDGFLYNMVRILTGTLIEIGRGSRKPEEIQEILEGRDRGLAGFTAPARGLTLVEVRY